jgi:hypothetical protein
MYSYNETNCASLTSGNPYDDNDSSSTVKRPTMGVKAAKRAKMHEAIATRVASKVISESMNSDKLKSNECFAAISASLSKIAENTENMFRAWAMQTLIENNTASPEMQQQAKEQLLAEQHQLLMAAKTKANTFVVFVTHKKDDSQSESTLSSSTFE